MLCEGVIVGATHGSGLCIKAVGEACLALTAVVQRRYVGFDQSVAPGIVAHVR